MRIAFITAGAGGMYCGSCMHDNTLASELIRQGHDALLIPTYTPITTDEEDVSMKKVFFGGINVFLEQKSWLFRHTPRFIDRLFNFRGLLRWVSRFAVRTKVADLADLTISMLQGRDGKQTKEIDKLLEFLRDDFKPDVILFTNLLLSGIAPSLKKALQIPILGILQGDDIFLEALPPKAREQAIQLIGQNSLSYDGYFATCESYADFMSNYLSLPRTKFDIVYPGLNLKGHGGPRPDRPDSPIVIGYFARICPEKGFHHFIDAYLQLRKRGDLPKTKIRFGGWLGDHQRAFYAEQILKLNREGLDSEWEHVECPDFASKVRFLQSIDLLSVPTSYHEPKGLYILEALANGIPVVQPSHGSFPELIHLTGGGFLVAPENAQALADGWQEMLLNPEKRMAMGKAGKEAVYELFTAKVMAQKTSEILSRYLHAPSLVTVSR